MVVPGRIVRQLKLGALRVHRGHHARFLYGMVPNRGNVTMQLRGHVTASLVRRGQQLGRLNPRTRRSLLPGAHAVLVLRYRGQVRGRVTAVVRVRLGPGLRAIERRYRLRL